MTKKRGGRRPNSGAKKKLTAEYSTYSIRAEKSVIKRAKERLGSKKMQQEGKAWLRQIAEDED